MVSLLCSPVNLLFLVVLWCLFVMRCSFSLSGGLTPLHAAVMSHNSVVKELRHLENPCLYMTKDMVQRKQTYVECIKILLLMGASIGSKVTVETLT